MMKKIDQIGNIIGKITKGVAWVSFIGVLAMMILNVIDVVLSLTADVHVIGAYELTQRILMVTIFASFAYAQTKKTHINMTIVISHFPRVLRYILFSIMAALSVVIACALSYAAYLQGGATYQKGMTTEVLYIPLYPFYYIEMVTMAIFAIALLYDLIRSVIAIFSEEMATEIQKDWD